MQSLKIPTGVPKPRRERMHFMTEAGPTLGSWMGNTGTRDFLEVAHPFVDHVKFRASIALVADEAWIRAKLRTYREYDIPAYTGGILFEIAFQQNSIDGAIAELLDLGYSAWEISENLVSLPTDDICRIVERSTKAGLGVVYEYGRKYPDRPPDSADQVSNQLKQVLEAGAEFVVIERSEIDLLKSPSGAKLLQEVIKSVGPEHVALEAGPGKFPEYPVWLIDTFGVNVNISNIYAAEVIRVEEFRRGLDRVVGYSILTGGTH